MEQTFALNHLAPFLLTNLLRDRLAGGRVVTTASGAHRSGRLDLDDLRSEKSYSPRVYGISKPFLRSPERGAHSLVWLARSDDAAALTGKHIEDEQVVAPSGQAQDDDLARRLWEHSAQLVSLPADACA